MARRVDGVPPRRGAQGVRLFVDRAAERFVRRSGWGVAVPLSLSVSAGDICLTAYPALRRAARRWRRHFGGAPETEESLLFLRAAAERYLQRSGYLPRVEQGRIYTCRTAERSRILGTTLSLASAPLSDNLTSYDLEATAEDRRLAFVTCLAGQVVSVAAANAPCTPGCTVEVGMETAKGWRGSGYAASNLAALADALLHMGCTVVARADGDNVASHAALLSAGFTVTGSYLDIVGER